MDDDTDNCERLIGVGNGVGNGVQLDRIHQVCVKGLGMVCVQASSSRTWRPIKRPPRVRFPAHPRDTTIGSGGGPQPEYPCPLAAS